MKPEHDNVNQNPKRRPPRYTPKLGDSVVVKPGVKDPDLGADIAGWQGRITEIDRANRTIGIDWDSLTLRQMPDDMIA